MTLKDFLKYLEEFEPQTSREQELIDHTLIVAEMYIEAMEAKYAESK